MLLKNNDGETMKHKQVFLLNAMILTATSLCASGAGVWMNLYLSARLGAQGMGLYQLILSVYSFAVTLASAGIHLAATRLVAEETAGKSAVYPRSHVPHAMRTALGYCLIFGCAAGALLFFGAPTIGTHWLSSTQTIRPLKIMALSMPLLSMSCTLGGYFTAVRRVAKPACAQIFEQLLRILLVTAALTLLCPVSDLETACILIAIAGVIAEVLSFLLEFLLYLIDRRRYFPDGEPSANGFLQRLLRISLPVAGSSYIRSGLTTAKNLLVPMRLQAAGLSSAASLSMFGTVHGVALPVILLPAALLNSFSGLIVPEMAQSHIRRQDVRSIIRRMFALNLSVSMGVCGILFAFAAEIGAAVSKNPDVGIYIRLLAPVIPLMYLDTAVDCMLKGLDEQVAVMRYNVYDAFISLLMVWFLLPIMGIKGYILMICLSELFNFALSFLRLSKVTGFIPDTIELAAKPLLCAGIATTLVHTAYMSGLFSPGGGIAAAFAVTLAAGAIYLMLLWVCGSLKNIF